MAWVLLLALERQLALVLQLALEQLLERLQLDNGQHFIKRNYLVKQLDCFKLKETISPLKQEMQYLADIIIVLQLALFNHLR